MTISKETWVDLQEKYCKVIKLIEDDSKSDPESEPYRSKYSARVILIGMKANLEKIQGDYAEGSKEYLKVLGMSAAVQLYLGLISIDTDELSQGEKHLQKCEEIIESTRSKPQMVLITLNMLNQFGILWFQRGDHEKSKTYLEQSQNLYESFKESDDLVTVHDIRDLFKSDIELEVENPELARSNFEKTHTFTLYYLAQVYGALGDAVKSSKFCHVCLDRQYQSGDFDPIDWALNAATLSQFFMEINQFKLARNHLSASSLILDKYKKDLDEITERDETFEAKIEQFRHRSADVARCWAKYGLLLLSNSKERLLKKSEENDEPETRNSDEKFQDLLFEMPNLSIYEAQITADTILTFQDSREVFVNVKSWLDRAELYYSLQNLASDFVEIEQDRSQLYLNLAFFEESCENQAKLHKRRVDILENVITNLNSRFYMKLCREVWFELGQIYAEILNIKSDKLRESGDQRPQPAVLAKINNLITKSLKNYQDFVKSFIDESDNNKDQVDPDKIPEDFQKAYLQAVFYTAALSSRFITLDKKIQLANTETSYKAYKEVLDFCEKKFESEKEIPMEFGICKEMVQLLPVKIAKLKREVESSS